LAFDERDLVAARRVGGSTAGRRRPEEGVWPAYLRAPNPRNAAIHLGHSYSAERRPLMDRLLGWCLLIAFSSAAAAETSIRGVGPAGKVTQAHSGFTFTEGPAADTEGNVVPPPIEWTPS
jgi:hypothetical protein